MPRATVFMGVPTLYVRMLAEAGFEQGCGEEYAPVHQALPAAHRNLREWQQRTGHTILERYGMSETIMLTSNPSADKRYNGQDERRGGTVGFPCRA